MTTVVTIGLTHCAAWQMALLSEHLRDRELTLSSMRYVMAGKKESNGDEEATWGEFAAKVSDHFAKAMDVSHQFITRSPSGSRIRVIELGGDYVVRSRCLHVALPEGAT